MGILGLIVAMTPVAAAAQTPNLVASNLVAPSGLSKVTTGQRFSVDARVVAEFAPVADAEFRLLLVPGRRPAMASELARLSTGPIEAAEVVERTVEVTVPSDLAGRFELALQVDPDDRVDETNPYDNLLYAAGSLRVSAPAPDFEVRAVTAGASRVEQGEPVPVTVTVANGGTAEAETQVRLRRSDGVGIGPDDPILATRTVRLAPEAVVDLDFSEPLGAPAGQHYLGATVDSVAGDPNGANNRGVIQDPVLLVWPTLAFTTDGLPSGVVDVPYAFQLRAAGGDADVRFSARNELPLGLSLTEQGRLEGVPRQSGSFAVQLSAQSDGLSATRTWTLTVEPSGQDLELLASDLVLARLAVDYGQVLARSGGEAPFAWQITSGALPAGVVLNDGRLEGAPEEVGTFAFTVQVTGFRGQRAERDYELRVEPGVEVVLVPAPLPVAEVEAPYEARLEAVGGTPPYLWGATSPLPPGIELSEGGALTGTPTRVGTFDFQVVVRDSAPERAEARSIVALTVEDRSMLTIEPPEPQSFRFREPIELTWRATGGTPPYRWSLVPGSRIPDNTSFLNGDGDQADQGLLVGQPNELGTFGFGVRVEDARGRRRQVPAAVAVRDVVVDSGGCRTLGTEALGPGTVAPWVAAGLVLAFGRWRRRRAA